MVADVDTLGADEDLAEEVRGRQLLGADQVAAHLEIRRTDFDYCVAAGWIVPAGYADSRSHRRDVSVPLYRVADVQALLELPGVDWEAVRAARPGEPSPLRAHARLPLSRAVLVRGFADDLADRYHIEVPHVRDRLPGAELPVCAAEVHSSGAVFAALTPTLGGGMDVSPVPLEAGSRPSFAYGLRRRQPTRPLHRPHPCSARRSPVTDHLRRGRQRAVARHFRNRRPLRIPWPAIQQWARTDAARAGHHG